MNWTVDCIVTYHRKWSGIEANTEEEAIAFVQNDDMESDDYPGNCVSVGAWGARSEPEAD